MKIKQQKRDESIQKWETAQLLVAGVSAYFYANSLYPTLFPDVNFNFF